MYDQTLAKFTSDIWALNIYIYMINLIFIQIYIRVLFFFQPCDPMFNSGPKNPFSEKWSVVCINAAQLMDDWEIPANEVIMEKLLGEGAFGEVYKGIIKCPIVNPRVPSSLRTSICTPVAIKLLKCESRSLVVSS